MLIQRQVFSALFFFFVGLASGCSSITPVGRSTYAAVASDHVEVFYQEPQRAYEVVSLVSHEAATRFATVPGVIEKCRELAAQSGADALIVTSAFDQTFNTAAKVSGKAIKWK